LENGLLTKQLRWYEIKEHENLQSRINGQAHLGYNQQGLFVSKTGALP